MKPYSVSAYDHKSGSAWHIEDIRADTPKHALAYFREEFSRLPKDVVIYVEEIRLQEVRRIEVKGLAKRFISWMADEPIIRHFFDKIAAPP